MEFDGTIIYILFAIAYVIFQIYSASKKKKTKAQNARPSTNQKQAPKPEKEEITSFEDLFKSLKQEPPSPKTNPKESTSAIKSKEELEKAKEALKKETHRIRPRIKSAEGDLELVDLGENDDEDVSTEKSFNLEEIDWPTAIVTKEILDRKYV